MTKNKEWNYFSELMQSWMVGYERAIMDQHFQRSKQITDNSCYYAVEDFTQRLLDHEKIEKILGKELNSMAECINHHVDNLVKAGLWDETHRPQIEEKDLFEIVVKVTDCSFREGCKWALGEKYFSPVQEFRCQRVGCFVGAIKKYLKEDMLPDDMEADYFMFRVHEEKGCAAVVFGREGFRSQVLVKEYLQGE